jgi:malonyl-CoA/methylmalonyl-CoA synthetase
MSPLLERLLLHPRTADVAVVEDSAAGPRAMAYGALFDHAQRCAAFLRSGGASLPGATVAFLFPPSAAYVETLLGIMLAGGAAVPLSPLHTAPELRHMLESAAPRTVLVAEALSDKLRGIPHANIVECGASFCAALPPVGAAHAAPPLDTESPALVLHTSGTTGKPKGVILSHRALAATCASLHQAWDWRREDVLLHMLPLHHTHGVVVALLGALWAGAAVRFAAFDARRAWSLLADASVLMAVPSIHARLLEALTAASQDDRTRWTANAAKLRLATSGSAALAPALFRVFEDATGQAPLERYGMTEIGMALSNPLDGPRLAGSVGRELPGVSIDIIDEQERPCAAGEPGELRVRSPQMFSGYLGDADATLAAFDAEGRFRTGDTGVRDETGVIRLLGRTSTDVLKSGGYKLSALEIEAALSEHPAIAEVAVIGLPDPTWGDVVTACVVARPGATLALADLRAFCEKSLAPYKIPRRLVLLPRLPRNIMGKVEKRMLLNSLG